MSKEEILATEFCEFQDMLACLAIYNGNAKPKRKRITNFDEAMELR